MKETIKQAYKQQRRDDERNQPKAIQSWFSDSWRRKYYLIEGQEDTHFRIYRENDGKTPKTNVWFSVAGTIDEAKSLADKFETEMPGNQGKICADKVRMAVPRWEAGEEKRRRKDYRLARKAAFQRPEPGFSLYEGRTRGKRMRYNYDDVGEDYDGESSIPGSGRSTPFDDGRPVITASGRQVKSRLGGMYGETMLTDQRREAERDQTGDSEDTDGLAGTHGRPIRSSVPTKRAAAARGRYAEGLESESESEADQEAEPSGDEWSGNEEEPDEESEPDAEDTQESDDDLMAADEDTTQESLVVKLAYRRPPMQNGHPNGTHGINGVSALKGTPLREVQNTSDAINSIEAQAVPSAQAQSVPTNGHIAPRAGPVLKATENNDAKESKGGEPLQPAMLSTNGLITGKGAATSSHGQVVENGVSAPVQAPVRTMDTT